MWQARRRWTGGGLYAHYVGRARYNDIVNNRATRGGVYFDAYLHQQEFKNNLVARNQATGDNVVNWTAAVGSPAMPTRSRSSGTRY